MSQSSSTVRSFRFLGRVQFTMLLLLGGAVAMVIGTVVESQAGREAAQASVYGTLWFDAYLLLIVVNLIVSVVNRIPIQRHQWAFVLTHASIVLLLFGAWVSRSFGYEGRLVVAEGGEEQHIWLDEPELRARFDGAIERAFPLGQNAGLAGRTLRPPAGDFPGITIDEFVPHGEFRASLVDAGGTGGPGVELHLDGMGIHVHEWLIGENRHFRRKDVGPFEIEVVVARSPELLQERLRARDTAAATVTVERAEGGEPVRLELPGDLDRAVDLGAGLQARVVRYLQRARVEAGGLAESPEAPVNPAAVVEITRGASAEIHTVFSEFPQFNLVKGRAAEDPLVAGVALQAVTASSKPLVTVVADAGQDQLYVQLSAGGGRGEGLAFQPSQTVGVGNLGLDLKVLKYLPSAKPEIAVRAAASGGAGEPWMKVTATFGGQRSSEWLRFGSGQTVALGDRSLALSWSRRRLALPFSVALQEFQIQYHPGSRRPAQYQSLVRVRGADGAEKSAFISMNRPLDVAGFRLFQSSYQLGRGGEPDETILTVSYDPGVPIVYPAFILLVIGVGWYLVGSGRRRALAARTEAPEDRANGTAMAGTAHRAAARGRRTEIAG